MWEYPYVDCICPVPLTEGLDLIWTLVMSFLRECWTLSLALGVWLVMEELESAQGLRQNFLSVQWSSPPCQGQGLLPSCWSRNPESGAWDGLFPLSVCFSFSPHWGLCPKGGESWSKWSLCTYRGSAHCLCRWLWLCSDAAHGCVSSLVLSIMTNYRVITSYWTPWAGFLKIQIY